LLFVFHFQHYLFSPLNFLGSAVNHLSLNHSRKCRHSGTRHSIIRRNRTPSAKPGFSASHNEVNFCKKHKVDKRRRRTRITSKYFSLLPECYFCNYIILNNLQFKIEVPETENPTLVFTLFCS
jgi:hypothetical protein